MQTILVTDEPDIWQSITLDLKIVSAKHYISNREKLGPRCRVISICRSYQYQTVGYYVSLLAEARSHKVIPDIMTLQDIRSPFIATLLTSQIEKDIERSLKNLKSDTFVLSVYFGHNVAKQYERLAKKLHALFPFPLFRVHFTRKKNWRISKISPIAISEIYHDHFDFIQQFANNYFSRKHYTIESRKSYAYDLAILYNPKELTPPSNQRALKKFIQAGDKLGVNVALIEKEEGKTLLEYDALFIRETTSVNHHTYRLARKASAENLVVIDDPYSILKCTNKVYLAELLQKQKIATPPTAIIDKHNCEEISRDLPYPCVLKQPDSSFSQGVVKVENRDEFIYQANEFMKSSELIIAQAFMPSEFDWRIGVLDSQPLFACQYYMAQNHWQIYNWKSKKNQAGHSETFDLNNVPPSVLDTAIRASKLIGHSLYGIDIKQINGVNYVIEINDNPNIDFGIEDAVSGDQIYTTIMNYFLKQMRKIHHE